jgi:hypothetical protein
MSFSNIDPASRQQVFRALLRVDPATAVRLAAVSKSMQQNSGPLRAQLDALKRVVRRKVARMRHIETVGGRSRLINQSLWNARQTAAQRGQMSPESRRASIKKHLRISVATRAYRRFESAKVGNRNAAWNRFVQIYVSSGGKPNITRNEAFRLYA